MANGVCRSEGMHQMVKSCYTDVDPPIKAHCFLFVQASKGIQVSLGKKKKKQKKNTPPHSQMPEFAKGLWVVGIHRCVFKNFIMNPAETCAPEQTSCGCKVPKLRKR